MRETADFDPSDFENPDDLRGLHIRFYIVPKQDDAASAEAGRPIFVDKEYVEIIAAGNANNIIRRPVRDEDKRRFRSSYERFRAGDLEQLVGTPLTEISWLTRSQVEELMYHKVRTVEQLAEISDQFCTSAPGLYELKRKAKAYVESADGEAKFTGLYAELEALRKELAAMQAERDQAPRAKREIKPLVK